MHTNIFILEKSYFSQELIFDIEVEIFVHMTNSGKKTAEIRQL